MPLRPPTSTLFPYTTLFRSLQIEVVGGACSKQADELTATQAGSADGKFHVIDNVTRHDAGGACHTDACDVQRDRKSTRLNSSHLVISYAVFCLKKKNTRTRR